MSDFQYRNEALALLLDRRKQVHFAATMCAELRSVVWTETQHLGFDSHCVSFCLAKCNFLSRIEWIHCIKPPCYNMGLNPMWLSPGLCYTCHPYLWCIICHIKHYHCIFNILDTLDWHWLDHHISYVPLLPPHLTMREANQKSKTLGIAANGPPPFVRSRMAVNVLV